MDTDWKKLWINIKLKQKDQLPCFPKYSPSSGMLKFLSGPNVEVYREPFHSFPFYLADFFLPLCWYKWAARAGKNGCCEGRNQSNLSLNSCEPGQPATLHLRLPFCVCPETTASFQSVPHLCISLCLLPLPKDLFLSTFSRCFCLKNAIQANELVLHEGVGEREKAWTCERQEGDCCCIWGRKLQSSCWDVIKNMCLEKTRDILPPPVLCGVAVEEGWSYTGVQDIVCCKYDHLQRPEHTQYEAENVNLVILNKWF